MHWGSKQQQTTNVSASIIYNMSTTCVCVCIPNTSIFYSFMLPRRGEAIPA